MAEGSAAALHTADGTWAPRRSVAAFPAKAAYSASAARAQRPPRAADAGLVGGAVALLQSQCGSLAAVGWHCAPCLGCAHEHRAPHTGGRRRRHGRLPGTSITSLRCCGVRLILRCSARASGERCAGHAAQRWAPGVPARRGQRPNAPGCSPHGRPPGPGIHQMMARQRHLQGQPLALGGLAHPLTPAALRARAAGDRRGLGNAAQRSGSRAQPLRFAAERELDVAVAAARGLADVAAGSLSRVRVFLGALSAGPSALYPKGPVRDRPLNALGSATLAACCNYWDQSPSLHVALACALVAQHVPTAWRAVGGSHMAPAARLAATVAILLPHPCQPAVRCRQRSAVQAHPIPSSAPRHGRSPLHLLRQPSVSWTNCAHPHRCPTQRSAGS